MLGIIHSLPGNVAADIAASAVIFVLGLSARYLVKSGILAQRYVVGARYGSRLDTSEVAAWISAYYDKRSPGILYSLNANGDSRPLAFLSLPEWHYPGQADLLDVRFETPLRKSSANVDDQTLQELSEHISLTGPDGAPWNSPLVILQAAAPDGKWLKLGWAEYYQYLSVCGALELETRRAIRRNAKTPLRDGKFSTLEHLTTGALQAQGVGICACVVFPDADGELQLLLQRRQGNVATYPGSYAVVPMFGCQPLQHDPPHGVSLKHDFFREFGEELFSIPELNYPTTHLRYDWFYKLSPVRDLLKLEHSTKLRLVSLGYGFDGLNGELDIAMLCLFESDAFFQSHGAEMRGNWEVKNIGTSALFSAEVDEIISGNHCHPGSAFAIDLTRRFLTAGKSLRRS